MPDKYGVGLGRNAISSQYTGVQRPKKKKKKPSDPMFIEFDTYDAQDGLMDEHDLNDIAKMSLRRGIRRAMNMSPQELSERSKKGWETRRRGGGHPTDPKLDAPISRYGLKYRKGNDMNADVRSAKSGMSDDQWRKLPKREFDPKSLNPTEEFIGSRHVDKVVAGETLREGYDPYVLIDRSGKAWIVDGHHRAAMYSALGRNMPAHVLDMRRTDLRKNILRAGAKRGGALIAAAMSPEERSARTKAGWLKRKRAKPQVSRPRRASAIERASARAEARRIVDRGRAEEPQITADIQDVVTEQGGKMYGLDFRLKEVESLSRKLLSKSREKGVSVEDYGATVADAVRYTAIRDEPPPGQYTNMIRSTIESLESKGYEILEVETHWQRGDAYNGIHLVAASPSGQRFELQFHTTPSVDAKFATHPLYEEMREDGTSPARRAELVREMVAMADAAPIPQGAQDIGVPVFRPAEA